MDPKTMEEQSNQKRDIIYIAQPSDYVGRSENLNFQNSQKTENPIRFG
ncbi:hypothetical protein [Flavobacterium luteolum]|nr:hypothetical protein [Flavobacterium luteolum]